MNVRTKRASFLLAIWEGGGNVPPAIETARKLTAAGHACPRDSDMQELALGTVSSLASLRRGDLVFWKGHVAVARDAETLIHANAHHMMVASEPAETAVARIKAAGSDVTSVKRIG